MAGWARCAWCGRVIGVRWWLRRGAETTGICRRCLRREYASYPELAQPEEYTRDHAEVGCFYLAAELLGAIAGGLYGTKLAAWIGWRLHWIPAAWIGALLAAAVAATWIYRRNR